MLAGGGDGGDVSFFVEGDFEGVAGFAFGELDEENGFACTIHGHVCEASFFAEGGLANVGEGGFELVGGGGEDGGPLAVELRGALVDEGDPGSEVGIFAGLEEEAVLVLVVGTVAFGVGYEIEFAEALGGEGRRKGHAF